MNEHRDVLVAEAVAQVERLFGASPKWATRDQWIAAGFKPTVTNWTAEDEREADHIRVESHSSRFI